MKEISNIKISCVFLLPKDWQKHLFKILNVRKITPKKSANIITIRDKYVFCIFEKKDFTVHFNVTKIKSVPDIFSFLFFFATHYFAFNATLLSLKIDNITASFNVNRKVNLHQLKRIPLPFRFNPERFSGFFIKFGEGTAIVFRNGKVNVIGCKSIIALKKLWSHLQHILMVHVPI